MLGYKVETRRLGWKKIGGRVELSTKSLVIWWFKKRWTIYPAKGKKYNPLAFIRRLPWRKTGEVA